MTDNIPHRPYAKPDTLIQIYRYMENFEKQWKCKPAISDFVEDGIHSSTSVVRYYLDRMIELHMIQVPQITRNGKTITPSRSIILLPLSEAHPIIQKLIEKEPKQ